MVISYIMFSGSNLYSLYYYYSQTYISVVFAFANNKIMLSEQFSITCFQKQNPGSSPYDPQVFINYIPLVKILINHHSFVRVIRIHKIISSEYTTIPNIFKSNIKISFCEICLKNRCSFTRHT